MEAHDCMSPAKQGVKKAKHIMEKRRRARINTSLAELKNLLPGGKGKKGSCDIKMEKADILERAVEHLRLLQETFYCEDTSTSGPNRCPARDDILAESYNKGYRECLDDVDDYLLRMHIEDKGMCAQVMRHIAYKKARFKQVRVNRTDFFFQDRTVKRCGRGLGQREGWTRNSHPRNRVAPPLSPYQHTHSPADSTTPGFHEEMRDDPSDVSAAVVKSEAEASSLDDQKENAALDCLSPYRKAAKKSPESKSGNRRGTTDSDIKLEFLNVGDGELENSNHSSVSINVVGGVSDNSRSSSIAQVRCTSDSSSNNDGSSSSSGHSIKENRNETRDDLSSGRHRSYINAKNDNNFLNAGKTRRFIVLTNRQNFASSKIENSSGNNSNTDSFSENGDANWTAVSSLPLHNPSEASRAGCSAAGTDEQSQDRPKPLCLPRSPRPSTQLRVDSELSGNSFRASSVSLDSSQPREAHSSSFPLSQQLSILIPASVLPTTRNQTSSPHRPLTDPSHAAAIAIARNDVNAKPGRPFPRHHNLLITASNNVDETASQQHTSSGSVPSTAATYPPVRNAEFSSRLLVAQLIKPLNEFPFPATKNSACNLTADSPEKDYQPCDLSVKSRRRCQAEEEREPEEKGVLCRPYLMNSQQDKTECTVWRPW